MADRGVTPVVGKALEVALLVLFVSLLASVLFGGVVPEYRSAAGSEVGERTLAVAADAIEAAAADPAGAEPTVEVTGERRMRVDLPSTLRGETYSLRPVAAQSGVHELVLNHSNPAVSSRTPLSLPENVETVDGEWRSGADLIVVVSLRADGSVGVELT